MEAAVGVLRPTSTLVGHIINELSERILAGEWQPGDLLPPQKALAGELGVGVSTIREATQVLVSMGMVESRPGKGTWICERMAQEEPPAGALRLRLSELQASTVFETRLVIEVPMTEYAAERATSEDIAQIQSALQEMEEAVSDIDAFARADLAFHLAVARASHNDLLTQFYQLASELLAEVIEELDRLPGVKEEAMAAHRSLARAIERHDIQGARESALGHLGRIGRLIHHYG
jgi:GntR family transcriptional regulator, transcriptional repressor for pyruvate dehydrogenase complex